MTREERILRAAVELFYQRGFHAVGVDEIGERAGMSGPAIYRHFSSKNEILGSIVDEVLDDLWALVEPPTGDPWRDLHNLIRSQVRFLLTDQRMVAVYVRESRSLDPAAHRRLRRRQAQHFDRWVSAVKGCYPGRPEIEVQRAAYAALEMLRSVVQWPADLLSPPGLEEQLVQLAAGTIAGLLDATSSRLAAASG